MVQVGAVVVARHRAQAAADLAALAAANRVADGAESACAQAASVARAMRTAVADCTVEGLEAVVTVEAAPGLGAWRFGYARAGARAGPVSVR
ncbi:helicase [Mycobacterium sp. GA-2829]|nr:helicase [Mycobacterium sp. GA-2829]